MNALAQNLHDTVDGEDCLHDPIEGVERRVLLHGGVSLDADKNARKYDGRDDDRTIRRASHGNLKATNFMMIAYALSYEA